MNHDAMNDSDQSSRDRSSTSGEKPVDDAQRPTDDTRRPFVKPELRREVGVVDGTGSTVSGMNTGNGQ
jgi:hypothetical protein